LGIWVLIAGGLSEENWDLYLAVPDKRFTITKGARNVLYSIVAEMKALNIDSKAYIHRTADSLLHEVSELVARQQRLKNRLAQWYRLFICLKSIYSSNVDGVTTLLLIIYTSVFIKTEAMLDFDQGIYDAYESKFA
jgi:hypothetical protein